VTLIYKHYCPACNTYGRGPSVCDECEGEVVAEAVAAEVEFNDEADAKRLAEIRAMDEVAIAKRHKEVKEYWDRMYSGIDYFAVATDVVKAEPTYSVGTFFKRQAS
jgi:hypothetical protein